MARPKYASMEERLIANSVLAQDQFYDGTPCWVWVGTLNASGYPYMSVRQPGVAHPRKALAHRVSIETFRGPIPESHVAMHLCNNQVCVSPLHLAPGTQSENIQQCVREGRHNSQFTEEELEEFWNT